MLREKIANETWSNFRFAEWVPESVQEEIKDFWCEKWGRGPSAWLESAERNKSPLIGDRVKVHNFDGKEVAGRFVYAWNNIGRLISDDGDVLCVGFGGFKVSRGGLWCKPESKDYFTVANTACTRPAFGSWYAQDILGTAGG